MVPRNILIVDYRLILQNKTLVVVKKIKEERPHLTKTNKIDPVRPEQWNMPPLFSELHPRKKQQGAAFLSSAFQTQITVGPMNSKLYFFHYQTCCICILSKTQTQPPKQTLPSAN
jgi:hypothetical protein